jgi:predicted metal-binding protein
MLQCPGVDQSLIAFPEDHICPKCNSSIEIWSDEKFGKCSKCGKIIRKISIQDSLIEYCTGLGVNAVKIIPSAKISIEQSLSEICKKDKCPGYGLAPSCPPHVMSTEKFQDIVSQYESAMIFKFEIPTNVLFGKERHEVLKLLHETSSAIKKFALNNGYSNAMAIAAGSCKQIFCKAHENCPIITDSGKCRHPETACPSMSGLGINFNKINKLLGWDNATTKNNEAPISNMAGIVLLKTKI